MGHLDGPVSDNVLSCRRGPVRTATDGRTCQGTAVLLGRLIRYWAVIHRSERSERRRQLLVRRRLPKVAQPSLTPLTYPCGCAWDKPHLGKVASPCYITSDSALPLSPAEVPVTRTVTLRKMGGSVGATIPKDLADRLHLDVGDQVFVVATEKGLLITPYDPGFEKAMAVYRRGAKKYKNALRELAK